MDSNARDSLQDDLVVTLVVRHPAGYAHVSLRLQECSLQTELLDQFCQIISSFEKHNRARAAQTREGFGRIQVLKERLIQSYLGSPRDQFGGTPRESEPSELKDSCHPPSQLASHASCDASYDASYDAHALSGRSTTDSRSRTPQAKPKRSFWRWSMFRSCRVADGELDIQRQSPNEDLCEDFSSLQRPHEDLCEDEKDPAMPVRAGEFRSLK